MMRYFHKPIVTAPFQHTFGAGAELMMAGGATVAAMELYAGLVEFGVGLIPAGGGCVSLLRRILNPVMETPNGDPMPQLQRIFETIAFAKVSGSALEARELGFLGTMTASLPIRRTCFRRRKRERCRCEQDTSRLGDGRSGPAGVTRMRRCSSASITFAATGTPANTMPTSRVSWPTFCAG